VVTPPGGATRGWPVIPYGAAAPWSVFVYPLDSVFVTSAFISSNSENISCVTFLKHKNSRKQELTLWHLVNRLVPENA
jgi:hypothetical protein